LSETEGIAFRIFVAAVLISFCIFVVILKQLQDILTPLAIALFLYYLIAPFLKGPKKRRVPQSVSLVELLEF